MRRDVRVIAAEGRSAFRAAILRVLKHESPTDTTYVVNNLEAALDLVIGTRPALAVIDRDLPGFDTLDFMTRARRWSPQTLIILTAARVSDAAIAWARKEGVRAYIAKSDTADRLHATVKAVLAGQTVFPQGASTRDALQNARATDAGRSAEELARREIQVLAYVARGFSTQEIAATLNLSAKVVDGHRANIIAHLDAQHRVLPALCACTPPASGHGLATAAG